MPIVAKQGAAPEVLLGGVCQSYLVPLIEIKSLL